MTQQKAQGLSSHIITSMISRMRRDGCLVPPLVERSPIVLSPQPRMPSAALVSARASRSRLYSRWRSMPRTRSCLTPRLLTLTTGYSLYLEAVTSEKMKSVSFFFGECIESARSVRPRCVWTGGASAYARGRMTSSGSPWRPASIPSACRELSMSSSASSVVSPKTCFIGSSCTLGLRHISTIRLVNVLSAGALWTSERSLRRWPCVAGGRCTRMRPREARVSCSGESLAARKEPLRNGRSTE
mmetsp:Transcript_21439/g.35379  ORF Transcript_21439/g.35379 Transcript_21439/m.35379 type:complete len:243 (+) Transcript_21439:373-1101(+)